MDIIDQGPLGGMTADDEIKRLRAENRQLSQLGMENAVLLQLLTDIGNEIMEVNDDSSFRAEEGSGHTMKDLANRINSALGISQMRFNGEYDD